MKFSIKDFFSKCDQIRIWSHLLKKSLMENFIFLCSEQDGKAILISWNNLHFVLKKEIILELILESWKYYKYELTQS